MRFGEQVVSFDFCGIPMVGNLDNGFVVGLTPEGAQLCDRLFGEEVPEQDIRAVDENLAECLITAGFFEPRRQQASLDLAYLHVTQRCNLNCAGCYSLDEGRNSLPDSPFESMAHAVDQLAQAGVKTLIVSGGEPFMRKDLPQLVRRAKEGGVGHITVITNGTCVTDDALAALAPWVDDIAVSFDGWSRDCPAYIREEQRFDQLTETVHRIQEAGIHAHITPTVHGKNASDLKNYVRLAQDLGTTMNYSILSCEYCDELTHLIPTDEVLGQMADTLLSMGDMPALSGTPVGLNLSANVNCGAGIKELSVGADGAVYPCHILQRPEYCLGNVFEEPIEAIRQRAIEQGFGRLSVEKFDGCRECGHKYLCGGGCRARSLFCYGDLTHEDGYCVLMKDYYDKLGAALKAQVAG